jgi:MULE transposase domain
MRCFPDLVLIDATYKTNRYNMPLLHFNGVTPNNNFFSAAFCFMPGEGEEECTWAVEQFKHLVFYDLAEPEAFITDNDKALRKALSQVFEGVPRILCSWHIQQNVLHRVKKTWRLADHTEGTEDYTKVKEMHEQCMKDWNKVNHFILFSIRSRLIC